MFSLYKCFRLLSAFDPKKYALNVSVSLDVSGSGYDFAFVYIVCKMSPILWRHAWLKNSKSRIATWNIDEIFLFFQGNCNLWIRWFV